MKKILTLFAALVLLAVGATAQKLSYSAVVRHSVTNELVANANLTVEIAITNEAPSETVTPVYTEIHQVQTNQNGLVTFVIGDGREKTGNMSNVTWQTAFVTSDYTLPDNSHVVNTVPVTAVPYALYAETAGNGGSHTETDPVFTEWNLNYNTLNNKPDINNGVLTIQKNGVPVGSFTANQPGNTTVNITIAPEDIITAVEQMTSDQKSQICQMLNCSGSTPTPPTTECPTFTTEATDFTLNADGAEIMAYTSEYVEENTAVTNYGFRVYTVTDGVETLLFTLDHNNYPDNVYPEIDNDDKAYIGAFVSMSDLPTITGISLDVLAAVGTLYKVYPFITCTNVTNNGNPVEYTVPGGETPTTNFTCGTDNLVVGNNSYPTVKIGSQCWTAQNMREAPIGATNGSDLTENNTSATDPFYYVKPGVDASVYGYYYNWAAANLVCPTGWHVPSDSEWMDLVNYMDTCHTAGLYKYRCFQDHSGSIAKALTSVTGWTSWNENCTPGDQYPNANNASGFGAVPAGYRDYNDGYTDFGKHAAFWSTTEANSRFSLYFSLGYNNAYIIRTLRDKRYAYSVRCLKD